MPAEVETMFSVREVPWHGLGTIVEEAPDSERALILAGLDWAVEAKPIYVDDKPVPGYVANVRVTDGQVLGIVSDRYKIVQNREAFMWTDALLGEGVKYETAGSLRNGRKVWLLARLPETKVIDDVVVPYLVFTNSHDGTGAVRVAITPIRVVCQNTLNLALRKAPRSWAAKHNTNIHSRLEEARRTLEIAARYMERLENEANQLINKKVSEDDWLKIIEQLIPMPKDASRQQERNVKVMRDELYSRIEMPDVIDMRDTAWGIINAVSDFATHMVPLRQTATYRERLFEKVINGHPMIDKAYELVHAL